MKAKFYIGFLSALLLTGLPVRGQLADNRDFRNDESGIVINNYYDDYDYYYSSRINRFHRSYAAFDYYSPVFTDTYWYNWQPFSWGVSIYGRSGFGFGYSINYPVYYSGGYNNWYGYDGWYDPYYGSSWYWGYDPFYYSWYSPVVININMRNRWPHNHWYGNNYWFGYRYRPVYNTYNNYYYDYPSTRYSSGEFARSRPIMNDRRGMNDSPNTDGASRRESVPVSGREANPAVNRTNAARTPMPSRTSTAPRTGPTISQGRSTSSSRSGSAVSQARSSSSGSGSKSSGSSSKSSSSSSSGKSRRK